MLRLRDPKVRSSGISLFGSALAPAPLFNTYKRPGKPESALMDYASYLHYSARLEVEPLPYDKWRMLEPQCKPQRLRKHQAAFSVSQEN
jgi:hypothetical protein